MTGIVSPQVSGHPDDERRLDDEKLETLRRWGAGIAADDRDELRAAGKAILILVEEIERLQVDVWHARRSAPEPGLEPIGASAGAEPFPSGEDARELESTLRGRVGRLLHGRSVDTS